MIADFLITCSGANKDILKLCQINSTSNPAELERVRLDRIKFVGIGGTVLFTALLACLSGGYAFYFTFQNIYIAILLGMFWGGVIFNLDRYIVSSIHKPKPETGITKWYLKQSWKQLFTILPRLFMAILIAITVSKPLEIKLFEGSIDKQRQTIQARFVKVCEDEYKQTRDNLDKKKVDLQKELEVKKDNTLKVDPIYNKFLEEQTNLESEISDFKNQINENLAIINKNYTSERYQHFYDEFDHMGRKKFDWKTRLVPNQTAINKMNENAALNNKINEKYNNIIGLKSKKDERSNELVDQVRVIEKQSAEQIAGVQANINNHIANRDSIMNRCKDAASKDEDILSRMRALNELQEKESTVWWASLVITFLFLMLESAPIILKMLAKRGPYEETLDAIEEEYSTELNQLIQTQLKINSKANEEKLKFEIQNNKELLEEIAKIQKEVASMAIEKWRQEQIDKINNK